MAAFNIWVDWAFKSFDVTTEDEAGGSTEQLWKKTSIKGLAINRMARKKLLLFMQMLLILSLGYWC